MNRHREEFGEEIAAADYIFLFPDGIKNPVRARVGKPYEEESDMWACPMELRGFESRYAEARGADSMQALCLAISFLRDRMEDFLEKGGKVLDPREGLEMKPPHLWSGIAKISGFLNRTRQ